MEPPFSLMFLDDKKIYQNTDEKLTAIFLTYLFKEIAMYHFKTF